MDVARGLGVALGDLGGQRLHHRHGERGGAARRLGERRGIVERGIAGLGDDRRACFFGISPASAAACASAASKRSMWRSVAVGEGLGGERRGAERIDQTARH